MQKDFRRVSQNNRLNRVEREHSHFRMYKAKTAWLVAGICTLVSLGVPGLVHADTPNVEPPATGAVLPASTTDHGNNPYAIQATTTVSYVDVDSGATVKAEQFHGRKGDQIRYTVSIPTGFSAAGKYGNQQTTMLTYGDDIVIPVKARVYTASNPGTIRGTTANELKGTVTQTVNFTSTDPTIALPSSQTITTNLYRKAKVDANGQVVYSDWYRDASDLGGPIFAALQLSDYDLGSLLVGQYTTKIGTAGTNLATVNTNQPIYGNSFGQTANVDFKVQTTVKLTKINLTAGKLTIIDHHDGTYSGTGIGATPGSVIVLTGAGISTGLNVKVAGDGTYHFDLPASVIAGESVSATPTYTNPDGNTATGTATVAKIPGVSPAEKLIIQIELASYAAASTAAHASQAAAFSSAASYSAYVDEAKSQIAAESAASVSAHASQAAAFSSAASYVAYVDMAKSQIAAESAASVSAHASQVAAFSSAASYVAYVDMAKSQIAAESAASMSAHASQAVAFSAAASYAAYVDEARSQIAAESAASVSAHASQTAAFSSAAYAALVTDVVNEIALQSAALVANHSAQVSAFSTESYKALVKDAKEGIASHSTASAASHRGQADGFSGAARSALAADAKAQIAKASAAYAAAHVAQTSAFSSAADQSLVADVTAQIAADSARWEADHAGQVAAFSSAAEYNAQQAANLVKENAVYAQQGIQTTQDDLNGLTNYSATLLESSVSGSSSAPVASTTNPASSTAAIATTPDISSTFAENGSSRQTDTDQPRVLPQTGDDPETALTSLGLTGMVLGLLGVSGMRKREQH